MTKSNAEIFTEWDNEIRKSLNNPKKKYPYYIIATDEFMSGWGRSENKTNKLIFCCETEDEALNVRWNLVRRKDMKNIEVRKIKPKYSAKLNFVQYYTSKSDTMKNIYNKRKPGTRIDPYAGEYTFDPNIEYYLTKY